MTTLDAVVRMLAHHAVSVITATSDVEGAAKARNYPLQAVVVDASDGRDVDELLAMVRAGTSAPTLVLTADSDHAGECVDAGADDCIIWPATDREVWARLERLGPKGHGRVTTCGPIELDRERSVAVVDGRDIGLTKREFELLEFMAGSPGVTFSSDELLAAVWGATREWQSIATIREHIFRLRNKIEADPANPRLIVTQRGRGYRLDI
jgi:DNA-binding response OmpR family regulator